MRITFGLRCKSFGELSLNIVAYWGLLVGSAGYNWDGIGGVDGVGWTIIYFDTCYLQADTTESGLGLKRAC